MSENDDASSGRKPLLLLDVDGVLNPYPLITKKGHLPPKVRNGETPFDYVKHPVDPEEWMGPEPLTILLSPDHGAHLRRLAEVFTLVWATTWEYDANRLISPILGLPELPVIEWPAAAREWILRPPRHLGTWKTKHVADWLDAHGRDASGDRLPWVWVDDDLTKHDRMWLRDFYGYLSGQAKVLRPLGRR